MKYTDPTGESPSLVGNVGGCLILCISFKVQYDIEADDLSFEFGFGAGADAHVEANFGATTEGTENGFQVNTFVGLEGDIIGPRIGGGINMDIAPDGDLSVSGEVGTVFGTLEGSNSDVSASVGPSFGFKGPNAMLKFGWEKEEEKEDNINQSSFIGPQPSIGPRQLPETPDDEEEKKQNSSSSDNGGESD